MGIRAAWRALVGAEAKASRGGAITAMSHVGRPVWSDRRYDKFADEGYRKNVVAYKAVNEVSRGAASVPLGLFRRGRSGDATEITDHPLLTLMARPNPAQAESSFFEAVYGFLMIAGNSYVERVGPERGRVTELWPKRPDRMKVIAGPDGLAEGWKFTVGGKSVVFKADPLTGQGEILHVKRFHPLDDWYGLSPFDAAAWAVDQHNAAGAHNKALLANGARPTGAVSVEGDPSEGGGALTDEQFNRLKAQVDETFAGAANAGRILYLEGGLKWQEMGLSPKDLDFIAGKHVSAREIAIAFGVPPQLLGIPGDSTYSNMREARLSLWEETIIPLVRLMVGELNAWLVPAFGDGLELRPDLDEIPALTLRRERVWEKVQAADFLKINEKRAATGYEDIEEGDIILQPATMVPLGFDLGTGEGDKGASPAEYKLLNDRTPSARQREWAIQARMRIAMERALTDRVARLLAKSGRAVARAFADDGAAGALAAVHETDEALAKALSAHWRGVMEAFGERILDALAKSHVSRETKATEEAFDAAIERFIAAHTAKRVVDISKTTEALIAAAIAEAEAEGLAIAEIVRRIIEKTGLEIAVKRAIVIARTETHMASQAAIDEVATATGLNLKREWIAANDARTRDTHVAADGQIRAEGEPFDVGGAKLMFPGDPAGPPAEVIQCRCVLGLVDDLDRDL